MAKVFWKGTTGTNTFAVILRPTDGFWYNFALGAFEAYNAANVADYDVPGTEYGATGVFSATFPVVAEGIYSVLAATRAGATPAQSDLATGFLAGGDGQWDGANFTVLSDLAATDPLINSVPDGYAQGTAGWALGRIGSGRITVVSPVTSYGDIEVVRGDSYLTDQGRALTWTDADGNWPTLTDAAISFEAGDAGLVAGGAVVVATGAGKQVRVELWGAQTDDLEAGTYDYNLVAEFPGTGTSAGGEDRVTLARATLTVLDREDASEPEAS
jgi:hypothetical protein